MPLYDCHNHSEFSFDGKDTTVLLSATAAAEKGLGGLCFTDHCDFCLPPEEQKGDDPLAEVFDVTAQQAETERVRELFRGRLELLDGIEIGVNPSARGLIAAHLERHHFDQVIASCHYIDGTDPYWGGYYEGKDWKEAYSRYLENLLTELRWLGDRFDVAGHYDYIARYAPYPQESILYKDFADIFDALLTFLAENGKALEFNTKTYAGYKGRYPAPDPELFRRFREKGGEAVTLGSDSHSAAGVALNFPWARDFLKAAGFRYMAHFEKRQLKMTAL